MGRFTFLKVKGRSMAEDAGEVSKDQIVVKLTPTWKTRFLGIYRTEEMILLISRRRLRQRISNSS